MPKAGSRRAPGGNEVALAMLGSAQAMCPEAQSTCTLS